MKTETKTGRWKYAAIVLIVTLLVGLFWSYVKNGPKGEIYLYGEEHSKQSILDKELSIWGEYYEKGMRDLFVEFPYTDAQFLNLWMQADDDELLDLQFKDWGGTEGGTEVMKNFLKQIKEQYPETVFHGTDVGPYLGKHRAAVSGLSGSQWAEGQRRVPACAGKHGTGQTVL